MTERVIVHVEYRSGAPLNPHEYGFHGDYPADVSGRIVEFHYEAVHTMVDAARMAADRVRADMLDAGAAAVELHETIVQGARS